MKTKIFLTGLAMGVCDAVPGISGGTIAFITGIYARLVAAIHELPHFLLHPFSKEHRKKADLKFLFTLGLGILVAVLVFSHIMSYLLASYSGFVMAFFVGLIAVSAIHIFTHIEEHHSVHQLLGVIGFFIGIMLLFLVPAEVEVTLLYVFVSGFLASSAMILPGISGSFILLILGSYGFIISAIANVFENVLVLAVLGLGVIIGLLVMSRIITQLFKQHRCATLYFLVGLVLGSLGVPIREILNNSTNYGGIEWFVITMLAILGGMIASILMVAGKKNE